MTTEIINRFNQKGIFPSDAELQIILNERETPGDSIYELEMELLQIAESDTNHPYYPKTLSVESDSVNELVKLIFEN